MHSLFTHFKTGKTQTIHIYRSYSTIFPGQRFSQATLCHQRNPSQALQAERARAQEVQNGAFNWGWWVCCGLLRFYVLKNASLSVVSNHTCQEFWGKVALRLDFFSVEILKLVAKSWARDGPEVDALKVGFRWVCRQAGYPKSLCFCSIFPIFQWTGGINMDESD